MTLYLVNLLASLLMLVSDSSVYYQYTEFISKNNQHRFKDVNMQNKVCRTYAQVDSECCVVKLLDAYFEKLPPHAQYFYMRPLERVPDEQSKPWYTKQRVGINTMKDILRKLSSESGCGVSYTNHSLRATATTRMFCSGVPEKVIAEKTGHRSLKALRFYERTQPEMRKAVDAVIADPKKDFSLVDEDVKPTDPKCAIPDTSTKCDIPPPQPAAVAGHTFSGTLSNCTINISYH